MAELLADDLDVAIGARIRVRRKQLGLSQEKLGVALGVSFQQVQKYERGANRVAASTLVRIAQALDTSPSVLLGEGETAIDRQVWSGGYDPQDILILRTLGKIRSHKVRGSLLLLLNRLAGEVDDEDLWDEPRAAKGSPAR